MGPVVPFLSDSPAQLESTVRQIAEAGATHVTPIVLHLRPGAREWFLAWLGEHHPDLVPRYRGLYGRGANAPKDYQQRIGEQVRELAERYRVGHGSPPPKQRTWRRATRPPRPGAPKSSSPCSDRTRRNRTPRPGRRGPQALTLTLTSRLGMMVEVPGPQQ